MADLVSGTPQVNAKLTAVGQVAPTIMQVLAAAVVRDAKTLVPRRTGNLGRSIHVAAVTPTTAEVTASANYAAFVEYGTRPHEITPKAKKALFFASAGVVKERFGYTGKIFRLSGNLTTYALRNFGNAAFVYAKVVHHPGTRPEPFMAPAVDQAIGETDLAGLVVAAWNEA
jgi:hypothetical protein